VHVPLAQQHVRAAVQFDLGPVVRVEEDAVPGDDRSDVGSHSDRRGPGQAAADRCRRRDHDAGRRAALAFTAVEADEHPVVEQPDG
jgi:hypothetical protein